MNIRHKRSFFYENCSTKCDYNFNLYGIFEKMTSVTQFLNQDLEQGKLHVMAAINSRK